MRCTQNNKANALITVLAVLLVISTMAVSFAKIAGSERLAASNYGETLKVRLLSEAGINFAISQLRRDFQLELKCSVQGFTDQTTDYKTGETVGSKGIRRWTYTALNDPNPDSLANPEDVEDDMAAGVPIEELQRLDITKFNDVNGNDVDAHNAQLVSQHPSYAKMENFKPKAIPGTEIVVSGLNNTLPNATVPTYTLKIISLSSQIDLNSHIFKEDATDADLQSSPLFHILDNLSRAIALREPYRSEFPGDAFGPLYNDGNTDHDSNYSDDDVFFGLEVLKL